MKLSVELSPEAEEDVADAVAWYEKKLSGLGTSFLAEIKRALELLSDHPESFPEMRVGVRRSSVRRFTYGIYYRVRNDTVEVIGVFHNRRSPKVWQKRTRN